jgi:hypothetical protein
MDLNNCGNKNDVDYNNFIESIPSLFSTAMQKATMCSFLWNKQDPETIVYNLRLYDIVRRLYYVKVGEEATDERVMELVEFVKADEKIMKVFSHYILTGRFPESEVIAMIK